MSNAALSWAWPIAITGPKKAVLVALAEHADDHGSCWPSIARLGLYSGVCERTVKRCLVDLEEDGLIQVDRSQGRTTNRYRLTPNGDSQSINSDYQSPLPTPPTVTLSHLNGDSQSTNRDSQSINHDTQSPEPLEPSRTLKEPPARAERKKRKAKAEATPSEILEHAAFWKLYPRKKEGSGACLNEWVRARKIAPFETIMAGLKRYPFDQAFLPMAATWLNQKRWLTEADTPPPNLFEQPTATGRVIREIVPY